jgi:peptide/nickel transport system substrate-binding protein
MRAPRLRAGIAVAAVVTLAVAGCAESKRDDSSSGTSDKTLVFGVAGDAKVLDPALASDGESFRVARQMYETLIRPEEGGAKLVAGLAV